MTTIHFCKECNNLLCPREDSEKKNLVYGCQNCEYEEPAQSNVVYYKPIRRTGENSTPVLNPEPILPVTKSVRCQKCTHGEATFFQVALADNNMTLFFVCTNSGCGYQWRD